MHRVLVPIGYPIANPDRLFGMSNIVGYQRTEHTVGRVDTGRVRQIGGTVPIGYAQHRLYSVPVPMRGHSYQRNKHMPV